MKFYNIVTLSRWKRLLLCIMLSVCIWMSVGPHTLIYLSKSLQKSNQTNLQTVLQQLHITNNEILRMCKSGAREKTIVLIPYRNRKDNLKLFISPIHEQIINQVIG